LENQKDNENKEIKLEPEQGKALREIELCFSKNINPICGLDPGMGKTIISCELIKSRIQRNASVKPNFLILHKASNAKDPWLSHLKDKYNFKTLFWHGDNRDDFLDDDDSFSNFHGVICTTYETCLNDLEILCRFAPFEIVIFDELYTNSKK
jgi:superfamily II DNA or RNA helicase